MSNVVLLPRRTAVLHDHDGCTAGRVHPVTVSCGYDYGGTWVRCAPDGLHDIDPTGLLPDRGVAL